MILVDSGDPPVTDPDSTTSHGKSLAAGLAGDGSWICVLYRIVSYVCFLIDPYYNISP